MSDAALAGAFVGVGVAILFIRLAAIERRLNRLSRLDAKVFDAIKRYRQATGAGLKERRTSSTKSGVAA